MFSVLGIDISSVVEGTEAGLSEQEIEDMLGQRAQAREDKDFASADRIRDQLTAAGVVIEDTADGATWHRS